MTLTRRRLVARVMCAVAVAPAGTACSTGDAGKALPGGPTVVTISLEEYRFDYSTPVAAGRVVFRFENEGKLVHQPDLLPLGEEVPPIDEQLRGDTRVAVAPFAGIPPRNPGETGAFAVDLVAGQRYAFVCFARDPDDDESHALKGMSTEFRAGGPDARPMPTTAPPTTTTTAAG